MLKSAPVIAAFLSYIPGYMVIIFKDIKLNMPSTTHLSELSDGF